MCLYIRTNNPPKPQPVPPSGRCRAVEATITN